MRYLRGAVKRRAFWARLLVLVLGITVMSGRPDAYAAADTEEGRTVRVAFFPMDGYHIVRADGSLDGMDVAYLEAVCEYTNWKIEYVTCDSWEQALRFLSERKVDLVGSAQHSAERAAEYEYAYLASGYTFGVIATNADGSIAYEDFAAMQGITFGIVKNYVRKNEFLQYLSDNGISNPKLIEYSSTEELQQALDMGEVDALVHTFTEIREGQRLIGRFAPRPFYYISYPGNDDVMRELNQAIADLKINRPELEASLMNTYYYSRFDKAALLTTEEKAYLAGTRSLVVGYLDGNYPFSYTEEGECKGLAREMLESSFAITGQTLEYRRLNDGQEARTALQNSDVDLLLYCTDPEEVLGECGLTAVREYVELPLVLAMDKDRNPGDVGSVAAVKELADEARVVAELQNVSVRLFGTQQECLDEVKAGRADAALCDGYMAEHLFRTEMSYENLRIKTVLSGGYAVSMAVRAQDRLLSGILTKLVVPIDSRAINEYMLKENTYPLMNVRAFLQKHSVAIISALLVLLLAVALTARHIIQDEKQIRKLMYKDMFLDIWNLNYLTYWGEHRLLQERRETYAVVSLNIARFRRYNVIYGWSAGEKLLEDVVEFLKENVDEEKEICARNHGDRFVLLLGFTEREAFRTRIRDLQQEAEQRIWEKSETRMPVQMGVYFLKPQERNLQTALNYAGQALEFAGENAEDTVRVYDDALEQAIRSRHEREKRLEAADVEKDFAVYYQPKVDIRNGEIVGAEALVRFLDPAEGGAVRGPDFFVPYYEKTGKITEIDFFVYETVCRMLRRRLDAGLPIVPVSCNFSRMHFIRPGFAKRYEEVLERYCIDRALIEVEITETLVIEKLQQDTVLQTLDTLHRRGIRLSIDDFGAGYSSLGIFEQVPASVIKLDRSFLLNQQDYARQVAILRGIVGMGRNLEAQIVCEGVETDADIRLMREVEAYIAQGYYYFRPIPEPEFEDRLSENLGAG